MASDKTKTGTKKTVEVVYIITSADHLAAPPRVLAAWVQHHWRVENQLHWVKARELHQAGESLQVTC
jgi:predicted transposase YbfD/YdcC